MVKEILHYAQHVREGRANIPRCLDLLVLIKKDREEQKDDIEYLNEIRKTTIKNDFNVTGILEQYKSMDQKEMLSN